MNLWNIVVVVVKLNSNKMTILNHLISEQIKQNIVITITNMNAGPHLKWVQMKT